MNNVFIHPTAVVETEEIGEGTYIGPFTYISSRVVVGKNCKIYNASLGLPGEHPHDPDDQNGKVIIEDNVEIREYVTINAPIFSEETRIGEHSYIMAKAHVGHDAILGKYSVLSTESIIGGHHVSGDYCYFGLNSTTHQRAKIGNYCMIGANAFFKGTSPDGVIWAGVPAKPIKVNEVGLNRHASKLIRKSLIITASDFIKGFFVYKSGEKL